MYLFYSGFFYLEEVGSENKRKGRKSTESSQILLEKELLAPARSLLHEYSFKQSNCN